MTNIRFESPERLENGLFAVDRVSQRVWFDGRLLNLSPRPFELLTYLLWHSDHVHSRQHLLKVVNRDGSLPNERTVDAWVARLRRELRRQGAPDPLRTVLGIGYVLDGY